MKSHFLNTSVALSLSRFDLDIQFQTSSQVLGIYGPSGSGKSTIIKAIAGIRRHTSGQIHFNNETWLDSKKKIDLPSSKRKIGYVPQDHLLFPHWNVLKNIEAGSKRVNHEQEKWQILKSEVISILELSELLTQMPDQLSGGEKQRVSLARAICSMPKLLLLDEPMASLDTALKKRILPFLVKIKQTFDIPIVIVSHNTTELLALCDEVLAIKDGKQLSIGKPNEVFAQKDVYATASEGGYQNIIPARLGPQTKNSSIALLGKFDSPYKISIPHTDGDAADNLLLGIPASDILVSVLPSNGVSARNRLPATIRSLTNVDYKTIITVSIDESTLPEFVVELTNDAIEELNLSVSKSIWLLFKSNSVSVFK